MNLKTFTNKNSSLEHADAVPALFEMTMIGFTKQLFNTKLPSYKIGINHIKENELDYVSLISDQNKIGKTVISEYIKDKDVVLGLYKEWTKEFGKMMDYYYDFFVTDLNRLSDTDLLKKSEELNYIYSQQVSMPGFIDGFMFYAEGRLKDLLQKFCKKNKISDPITISSILTSPISSSFLNEEENDLIAIVKRYSMTSVKKSDIEKSLSDKKIKAEIEKHILKYSWIKDSYAGYKEYTKESVTEEIERIIKEDKKGETSFVENKKKKLDLIEKYNLDKEIVAITELSDILIKWQDQRKQYTLTFVALKNKVLKEISKRIGISFDLIVYSLNSEIKDILNGKFDLNILKNRKAGVIFVYQKGKPVKIITGNEVTEFMKQVSSDKVNDITEIKGSVASIGKAKGIVKVVTSMKYISKVNIGDILVAPMTRPEYLPGMRNAAAIVTDDGGITCHAAIIARELKKPCIIGTKIATQVLKDGDLVEVDANTGIIKIIK